jgi:hypothetical protein
MLVRPTEEMEDEDFHRHLEMRHLPKGDWAGLVSLSGGPQFNKDRRVYQAWHQYCHRTWSHSYDHEHPA